MDRQTLNTYLCAVLTTLDDVQSAPETALYLGVGCDLDRWQTVRHVLLAGELATCENHTVRITLKGKAMAKAITAHVRALKAAA